MHAYWTSMLWSIDSCQNVVSATLYHLTLLRAGCRPIEAKCLGQVIRWQVTTFQMITGSSLIFFKKFIWNMLCLCAAQLKFDFKRTSDAKIQPAITGKEDSWFWLFSPWSRVGHALRPIFMLWLVKVWQASSCGIIYTASWNLLKLCQLQLTEFVSICNVFNCLFPLDVQNEIQLTLLNG